MKGKALTPDQVKAKFVREGKTFADWAREHGHPPVEVYKVVNGLTKGKWGRGHTIAIQLGLKVA